jgi:hypothetical protein
MAQEPSTQPIAMKNPHTNHTKMESSETAWYMISPQVETSIIEQAAQQWSENSRRRDAQEQATGQTS